jgi:hypothetical protein
MPYVLYVWIKFVSDLVGGFLQVLRFSPPITLTAEILLKEALNTIKPIPYILGECMHLAKSIPARD